jgi:hypothetical protein
MRMSLHKFFSLFSMVLVLISCTIRLSPSAYDGSAAEFRLKVLPHLKHILKILLCGQYLSIISSFSTSSIIWRLCLIRTKSTKVARMLFEQNRLLKDYDKMEV